MTLCTFNVQNLYARVRFSDVFPGDMSGKSRDGDPWTGFMPSQAMTYELFNERSRELAAKVLRRGGRTYPDVVCLQEVESLAALRAFNERYLGGFYPTALLVDSRDPRNIDVGVLCSARARVSNVRSHIDARDGQDYLSSRDCLEVDVRADRSELTLFVNHLKSRYSENALDRRAGDRKRERQAAFVAKLTAQRARANKGSLFAVVGDLNDEPRSKPLAPLMRARRLTDVFELAALPDDQRWTHWWRGSSVSQMDYILVSESLAKGLRSVHVERRGIGFERVLRDGAMGPRSVSIGEQENGRVDFTFARFDGVDTKTAASDHAAVFASFDL